MEIKIDSKLSNNIYNDGLKDSVTETSKVVSLVPRAINAALSGLRIWILKREFNVKETEKLLEEKLANVSEEKIIPPDPYVAVPAFQAISYSMDSEELRNMYANLLSKAMNKDTKKDVHPAFTEIIKQMSPIDAQILKKVFNSKSIPLIDVIDKHTENGSYIPLISNLTNIFDYDNVTVSVSLNNLIRLGLAEIPAGEFFPNEIIYDTITSHLAFIEFKKKHKSPQNYKIDISQKLLSITALGFKFCEICIKDL